MKTYTLKLQAILLTLVLTGLTVACQAPTVDSPTTTDSSSLTMSPIAKLLVSLPSSSSLLPASLSDGGTSSQNSNRASRTIGDITSLDPSTSTGVRSEGYIRMQKNINESLLSSIMTILQTALLKTSNYNPAYDTTTSLGTIELTADQAAVLGVKRKLDAGKLVLTKLDSTGNQVDIKWRLSGDGGFRLPDSTAPAASGNYDYAVHVIIDNVNTPVNLSASIALRGTKTLSAQADDGNGHLYPSGTIFSVAVRGKYDAASDSQTVIYTPETNDQIVAANQSGGRYESITKNGSTVTLIDREPGWANIAYGYDSNGGLLSVGSFTIDSSSVKEFRSEFYNSVGELLGEKRGTAAADSLLGGWLSGLDGKFVNLDGLGGVTSSTSGFQVKTTETWVDDTRTVTAYAVSIDSGASWTAVTSLTAPQLKYAPWIVVAKSGATWAAGDSVYYNTGVDKTTSLGNVIYSYQKGFSYPSLTTVYGDSYYISSLYPFKYVQLNSTLTAAGYGIRMIEEGTDTFAGLDGSNHSATRYRYYLSNRGSADGFKPGLGDLEISNSLRPVEFRHWNSATYTHESTKAYVLTTTETIPPNFTILGSATIDSINSQLDSLATSLPAVDNTSLSSAADALGVSAISDSDLTSYP